MRYLVILFSFFCINAWAVPCKCIIGEKEVSCECYTSKSGKIIAKLEDTSQVCKSHDEYNAEEIAQKEQERQDRMRQRRQMIKEKLGL